jgi:hypothetical protein
MKFFSHPLVIAGVAAILGATVLHGPISGLPGVNKIPQK